MSFAFPSNSSVSTEGFEAREGISKDITSSSRLERISTKGFLKGPLCETIEVTLGLRIGQSSWSLLSEREARDDSDFALLGKPWNSKSDDADSSSEISEQNLLRDFNGTGECILASDPVLAGMLEV